MNRNFVALAAAIAFIAGCNTIHGVGEDISAGGRKVEDVLKKDKPANDSNVNAPANPEPGTTGSNADRMPAPSSDAWATTPPSGTSTQ